MKTILVTGGAGYIGAVLVPQLLERDYLVRVLDLFLYGERALPSNHPNLTCLKGDIRDPDALERVVPGADAVIHLAGIPNDPGFELNPRLGKSINYDSFEPLVSLAKDSGAKRFIFASSGTVYGLNGMHGVTEDRPLRPITDYDRYKGMCETLLHSYQSADFSTVVIRSATICGYSPRQRLDLVVNILTNLAVHKHKMTILGAGQQRPSLHVDDAARLYADLLDIPDESVTGGTFNAARENHTFSMLASIVCDVVQQELPQVGHIELETADAERTISYDLSADHLHRSLGWRPTKSVEDAVVDLCRAFRDGKLPNPLSDPRYYNVKMIQSVGLV